MKKLVEKKTMENSMKNVLITGGSSGVGAALVRAFATNGFSVWFTYNSGESRAHQLINSLPDTKVVAFQFDQGNEEEHDQLIKKIAVPIQILINNAAVGTKTVEKVAKTYESQDEALIRINALGPLWLTSRILPHMKKQRSGKILFISSVDGGITHFPGARFSDGMSKAALTHYAKQLASELVDHSIDVYTICPGATETPMFSASTLANLSEQQKQDFLKSLPAGRLVDPTEIANLALFLSSAAGKILRGATLDASLGLGNNPFSIHANRKQKE